MQENNPVPTPVVTPQVVVEPSKNNSFLIILLSILLFISVAIAGFFAFQTQKLVKELTVLKTEEKVVVATTEPTVEPVATDSSKVGPTANWKIYTNTDFSYKYPTDWKEGQGGQTIVSNIAGANITNFSKDMPMYNECMKLDKTDIKNGLMVKYYTYASSGEMCTNQANMNNKEIWITKVGSDGFQPGLIYYYNEVIYPSSTNIFNQILSTFKFTN